MKQFTCISASEQSSCREKCKAANADRIKTFKGCVGCEDQIGQCFAGHCSSPECFDVFTGN
jgi:hypothetical protein